MEDLKQGGINRFANIFLLINYRIEKIFFLLRKIKNTPFIYFKI